VGRSVDEKMNSRRFHLTLPSNSSMGCYPNNTVAQFTTKLPHPISLEGDWEVALTEISVPAIFNNVLRDSCVIALTKDSSEIYTFPVEPGYYKSINELVKWLSDILSNRGITFAMYRNRVKIINSGEFHLKMNDPLAKKLGFQDVNYMPYGQGNHIAPNPVDMSQATVPTLFVYCDALEHVVVGDVTAPLLRIVDMNRKKTYGRMHQVLNPPMYVPLQKKHFDTIEINIMSDTGEAVPFVDGKSVVVLEFKRIGLLEKVI